VSEKEEYWPEHRVFHAAASNVMGTVLDFVVCGESEEKVSALWKTLYSRARVLDSCLNRFKPDSEVSRFNSLPEGAVMECSRDLSEILAVSLDYNRRTGGLFDVTKGKAAQLSFDRGHLISKFSPGVSLDFGGIAKGYLLALVKEMLGQGGVADAFVNFGCSSILAMGHHPFGDCWKVSPEFDRTVEFNLRDTSLSLSGNQDGYCGSIVNPLTGERMMDALVRVVESEDPLEAEVLSTVLCISDSQSSERFLKEFRITNYYTYDRGKRN